MVHAAALNDTAVALEIFSPDDDALADFCAGARSIAIDAPSELSTAAHRDDVALAPKFRTARCGEVALGRDWRMWVPWVTPTEEAACAPWMRTGFAVWRTLRAAGHEPIEVYPYACFTLLAGRRLPRKTSAAGREARAAVLRNLALDARAEWAHDHLDAVAAAHVARQHAHRCAIRASCDHDGSAIWLPAESRPTVLVASSRL
jgi:predicted nuclease with RNAse H fold